MTSPKIGLFRNDPTKREGKYLVLRRDGTIPEWSWFILGAMDPAAPGALDTYAATAKDLHFDADYVRDVANLGLAFTEERVARERAGQRKGDPDAGPHRTDDPLTLQLARGEISMREIAARLCATPLVEERAAARKVIEERNALRALLKRALEHLRHTDDEVETALEAQDRDHLCDEIDTALAARSPS